MPQTPYRANLSAANFPMTLAKAGRTVIRSGVDQNFDRRVDPAGEQKGSVGIPQALYMQDVIPTVDGYQSVGYNSFGTINIPGGSSLTGILTARVSASTAIGFGITDLDTGDSLTPWTHSSLLAGPGGVYTEVVQNASIGHPAGSYEFRNDEVNDPGEEPYIHKSYNIVGSSHIQYSVEFMFATGSGQDKQICIHTGATVAGVGLAVRYAGTGNFFQLVSTTHWGAYGATVIASGSVPVTALDVWYKILVDIVVNPDTSKTVNVTFYDTDGTTVLSSISWTGPVTLNSHFGFSTFNGSDSTSTYNSIYADNLSFAADGVGFESEVRSVILTFFADNTVKWSYAGVAFTNTVATLPGGFVSPVNQDELSFAFVRGNYYVAVRTVSSNTTKIYSVSINATSGVLSFTDVTATIDLTLPDPFTVNDVKCIVGSYNYLILLTKATAFWSSTTTPTDFAASLVSGAGFESINNLKDNITFAKEHSAGFAIYTSKNAVFAQYTGNARYPWKFREIQGSGGFSYQTQVSGDTNTALQVGITNTGQIQSLSPDDTSNLSPEASEFFERNNVYDRLDLTTGVFSLIQNAMKGPIGHFQIYLFLDRYILAPYGRFQSGAIDAYEYILVYDTQLRRFGKLRTNANFLFCDEQNIYFVEKSTGTILGLDFNIYTASAGVPTHNGFILLGKFELDRGEWIQLEELEFESTTHTAIITTGNRKFEVYVIPSFDGKNFNTRVAPFLRTADSTGSLVSYYCHENAQNLCVSAKGAFDLVSLGLVFDSGGH